MISLPAVKDEHYNQREAMIQHHQKASQCQLIRQSYIDLHNIVPCIQHPLLLNMETELEGWKGRFSCSQCLSLYNVWVDNYILIWHPDPKHRSICSVCESGQVTSFHQFRHTSNDISENLCSFSIPLLAFVIPRTLTSNHLADRHNQRGFQNI